MRKIFVSLIVMALLFCAGCDLIKPLPTGTPAVSENSSDIVSSSISEPLGNVSVPSVTDTTSRPQSTTSKLPTITESVTRPSGGADTSSKNESTVAVNPYAKNSCYKAISAEQQRIYRIIHSALKNVKTEWISLGNCRSDYLADIAVAYRAVTYDYPEFFWVPYTYVVNKGITGVKIAFELNEDNSQKKYLVSPDEVEGKQEQLNKKVQEIIDKVEKNAETPYEKVLYLHDLLIKNTTYSSNLDDDMAYTAYGALVNNNAVCEGYSRAMSYLCKKMGVDCILVTGISKELGHMWNLVKLDDKWYHIDVTWDDAQESIDYPLHTYFCLTDEQITVDHTIDPDVSSVSSTDKAQGQKGYNFNLAACTATKYNYFEHTGYYISDDIAQASKLIEGIYNQSSYIELKFKTPELLEEYEALDKRGRDTYIIALSKNVTSDAQNGEFSVNQYALIRDCLYIEW